MVAEPGAGIDLDAVVRAVQSVEQTVESLRQRGGVAALDHEQRLGAGAQRLPAVGTVLERRRLPLFQHERNAAAVSIGGTDHRAARAVDPVAQPAAGRPALHRRKHLPMQARIAFTSVAMLAAAPASPTSSAASAIHSADAGSASLTTA